MKNEDLASLDELKNTIEKAKKRNKESSEKQNPESQNSGGAVALKVGIELVSGGVAGCLIGYFFDSWLGTTPFAMILCVCLGFAGGLLNIYRLMNEE